MHHAQEFTKFIRLIFNYLFVDSYRYEQIFKLFVENVKLIPTVVMIIG